MPKYGIIIHNSDTNCTPKASLTMENLPFRQDEIVQLYTRLKTLEETNLELRRIEQELTRRTAYLALIHEINRQITTLQEPQQVLELAAELVRQKFGYHHVALFLREGDTLYLRAVAGVYRSLFPEGHTQKITEGINGWVATHGEKILANDVSQEPRFISLIGDHSTTRAELCLPLKMSGKILGVLDIQSTQLNAFHDHDVVAMEILADQLAIALENARLYKIARQQRQVEEQLQQAQKMEVVGRLTGGIAHDFNNILAVILGHSECLLVRPDLDGTVRDEIAGIKEAAERAARLVRQLLVFSRQQPVHPQVIDLNQTLHKLTGLLRRVMREDIHLQFNLTPNLPPVKMDPVQVEQVIMNLAVNAADAMPQGGMFTLETGQIELEQPPWPDVPAGRYVTLSAVDTGIGMDEHTLAHCFEPFFTTKADGQGTGLGLSTVYGIVRQNGGFIQVYSRPGEGTTFTIFLPPTGEKAEISTLSGTEESNPPQPGKITILLIEDEANVRKIVSRMLALEGYEVLTARTAEEASQICRQHPGPIHLLISDVVLPETRGPEVVRELRKIYPALKVLYISGYFDEAFDEDVNWETNFLQKPFTHRDLLQKISHILSAQS